MQINFRFKFALILAIFILGGCRASFDMYPEKPQLQSQSQESYYKKVEELESELQELKSQNAARMKELDNGLKSLRYADTETQSSERLEFFKELVTYGKLYDADGFRYVNATEYGKKINAVLEWEANGNDGMLILDKLGLFLEISFDAFEENDFCYALYEGDGEFYETDKGLIIQSFNHLCLRSDEAPLYLYHFELGAPSSFSSKIVLSEYFYFEGVDDATMLRIFIEEHPNARIINSEYL